MKNLRKIVFVAAVLCLPAIVLTSCLKDHNYYNVPATSLLMVVQGSPGAPAESLFLDPNQVNNSPFNYQDYIGYFNAYAGVRNVVLTSFNYPGTGMPTTKYASDTVHLDQNQTYSLFLANTVTKPDFILLNDSIGQPTAGMATIRLVNVSPDAGSVDLAVNDATVLVSNKAYKGASSFLSVAGDQLYKFSVRAHGTTTVIAYKDSVAIAKGGVYTVWLHGLKAGSGTSKLATGVINNARF